MEFPTLNRLLSDLPPHAVAPASPSSTSVSDGSGPDDFDDQIFAGPSFTAASGQPVSAPSWRGGGERKGKGRETKRRGRGGVYETDDMDDTEQQQVDPPGMGGDKLPYEIWMNVSKGVPLLLELLSRRSASAD